MPDINLQFRWRRLQTELGHLVLARRPFVTAEIEKVRPLTFIDTGAPVSVVSLSVANQISWQPLGTQFVSPLGSVAIDWHGIPCELGETHVDLLDLPNGFRIGPLLLVAKFARQPHPTLENQMILGMNFLSQNSIDFHLHTTKPLSGFLSLS